MKKLNKSQKLPKPNETELLVLFLKFSPSLIFSGDYFVRNPSSEIGFFSLS